MFFKKKGTALSVQDLEIDNFTSALGSSALLVKGKVKLLDSIFAELFRGWIWATHHWVASLVAEPLKVTK